MKVQSVSDSMKEPESQVPDATYLRHGTRDINLGIRSSKASRESDIGVLVACKVQLSSEIIQCKTESLRLQKERDSAQQRVRELDLTVAKLNDRSRELEERLKSAEVENYNLKARSIALNEQNSSLLQKLSSSPNRYHSFPWSEDSPLKSQATSTKEYELNSKVTDVEDWRDISQKILQQMKEEMKELEQISLRFCGYNTEVETDSICPDIKSEETETELSLLQSEMENLKQVLHKQRTKIAMLYSSIQQNKTAPIPTCHFPHTIKPMQEYVLEPSPSLQESNEFNVERLSQEILHVLSHSNETPPCPAENSGPSENERVCPICQESFDSKVLQEDFEDHVLEHLEKESASLMDQFEIL